MQIFTLAINTATTNKGHEVAINNFGSAIVRQLFAYSRSSYSNFSVQTVSILNFGPLNLKV
jgi:hypothetical protein